MATEWVTDAVVAQFLSELVTGNVVLKGANTTTSQRMSTASVVELHVRAPPLLPTLPSHRQCINQAAMEWVPTPAWVPGQWAAPRAPAHLLSVPAALALAPGLVNSLAVRHQVSTLCRLVLELRQADMVHPWVP